MQYKKNIPDKYTPLFEVHKKNKTQFVNFSGWNMPLHYGSQINEHNAVRTSSGIFDVSHMTIIDVTGPDSKNYLKWLLANDVSKLVSNGSALYSVMLNDSGGVIDDLIVYFVSPGNYRLVVNCATGDKDFAWMKKQAQKFDIILKQQTDFAIMAVQGPDSIKLVKQILTTNEAVQLQNLKPFTCIYINDIFFSRTGYTGEDGLEIITTGDKAIELWEHFIDIGITPCGIASRDTLRLEAGLNLYGAEMDENTNPFAANLGWSIAFNPGNRDFCGRYALEFNNKTNDMRLVGVLMKERGVLRSKEIIHLSDNKQGVVTSGIYSPTLGCSIALARLPINASFKNAHVQIRNKTIPVTIGSPKFVKKGKIIFTEEL